jgi:hypothetical protein
MSSVDEPRRLLAEDLLLKVIVEEGVGHVHLMDWPDAGDRKM